MSLFIISGIQKILVYQKALIQTFNTSFWTTKQSFRIHIMQTQVLKVILYQKPGLQILDRQIYLRLRDGMCLEFKNPSSIRNFNRSTPLPFYASQIINPFLNSRISANQNYGQEFQPIVKSLYPLMFLQCRISFKPNLGIFSFLFYIICTEYSCQTQTTRFQSKYFLFYSYTSQPNSKLIS